MATDDDSLTRIAALENKIARLEQELEAAKLTMQRASVQQGLLDDRLLILERNRLFRVWNRLYRAAARLYARSSFGTRHGGVSDLRTPGDYARWIARQQYEMEAEDHRAAMARWPSQPNICVVLTGDSPVGLQSLSDQIYPHWKLCRESGAPDGEYRLLLHPGDRLSSHALYFYAQALVENDFPDLVYADEDHIETNGDRSDPIFKPGWSPELLLSTTYLGQAIMNRGASSSRVVHIPRVLYHRGSRLPLKQAAPQYHAAAAAGLDIIICSRQVRQIGKCLEAIRKTASIPNHILVVHHLDSGDGRDMRSCVERFGGTCIPYRGPFDFARMNNLAAARATTPHLLFMNDDIVVRQPGWDHALCATLARAEIGIAGFILEYPDGTIQHAGIVTGMGDAAGHCGRFQKDSRLWPWLRMSRDVSAVTGAMLGMRSDLFRKLQGFDESFPINYNDVDLCLRVRKAGLRIVCLNVGHTIHGESQTRIAGTHHVERDTLYQRWAHVLSRPDPFYSPHLAPTERIALSTGKSLLSGLS
jgi:Glycosyltransferase like family 2